MSWNILILVGKGCLIQVYSQNVFPSTQKYAKSLSRGYAIQFIQNRKWKFLIGKLNRPKYWIISVIFGSLTFNMLLLIPETGNCMPKACLRQFLYALYAFFRVIFGVKEATLTQTDGDVVVLLAQETYAAQAYISCLCVRTHLNWRKACVRIGFHFPANTIEQVTSMLLFLLESVQ